MKIIIGSDHAGFELKEFVINLFKEKKVEVVDSGTYSKDSTDYPDFAHKVAHAVNEKSYKLGILICGSANGVAMTANKYANVRAAICWTPEIAKLARQHNHANILCLPSRFISKEEAWTITQTFLSTQIEEGRHLRRVEKINQINCS